MKTAFILFLFLLSACATKSCPENTFMTEPLHYKIYSETPATPVKGKIVDFYDAWNAYGEFSNFALFPVFLDEKWWPTSEHYYQAHKYTDAKLIEWVRTAPTPMDAALRGREESLPKRSDWADVKESYMEKAVMDKFQRYPILKNLLLSTGEAQIYEHTKNDCEWGDCGDRTGKNKLGKLLEKVRSALKK
jgi:ribA/ribD-fused uncharacterized protein